MNKEEKIRMISYDKNIMNSDMELLEEYSSKILKTLIEIETKKEYYQENIEECRDLVSRIKGYAQRMKHGGQNDEASHYLITGLTKAEKRFEDDMNFILSN